MATGQQFNVKIDVPTGDASPVGQSSYLEHTLNHAAVGIERLPHNNGDSSQGDNELGVWRPTSQRFTLQRNVSFTQTSFYWSRLNNTAKRNALLTPYSKLNFQTVAGQTSETSSLARHPLGSLLGRSAWSGEG